jgi:hypothetical protein
MDLEGNAELDLEQPVESEAEEPAELGELPQFTHVLVREALAGPEKWWSIGFVLVGGILSGLVGLGLQHLLTGAAETLDSAKVVLHSAQEFYAKARSGPSPTLNFPVARPSALWEYVWLLFGVVGGALGLFLGRYARALNQHAKSVLQYCRKNACFFRDLSLKCRPIERIPGLIARLEEVPDSLEQQLAYGLLTRLDRLLRTSDFWDVLGTNKTFGAAWRAKIARLDEETKSPENEVHFRYFDEFLALWDALDQAGDVLPDTTVDVVMWLEPVGGNRWRLQETAYPYGRAWDQEFLRETLAHTRVGKGGRIQARPFGASLSLILGRKLGQTSDINSDWQLAQRVLTTLDAIDPGWTQIRICELAGSEVVKLAGKHVLTPRDVAVLVRRSGNPECCVVTDVLGDYTLDVSSSCFCRDGQRLEVLSTVFEGTRPGFAFEAWDRKRLVKLMESSPTEQVFRLWERNIGHAQASVYAVDISGTFPENGITCWATGHYERMGDAVLRKAKRSLGIVEVARVFITAVPADTEARRAVADQFVRKLSSEWDYIACYLTGREQCERGDRKDFQVIDGRVVHRLDVDADEPWTKSKLVSMDSEMQHQFDTDREGALAEFTAEYIDEAPGAVEEYKDRYRRLRESQATVRVRSRPDVYEFFDVPVELASQLPVRHEISTDLERNGGTAHQLHKFAYLGPAGAEAWRRVSTDPDYDLGRRETEALEVAMGDLTEQLGERRVNVVHVGPGDGVEIPYVVQSLGAKRIAAYHLVDISADMLRLAGAKGAEVAREHGAIQLETHVCDVTETGASGLDGSSPALTALLRSLKAGGTQPNLVLLVANGAILSDPKCLESIRAGMSAGDYLVITVEAYSKVRDSRIREQYRLPSVLALLARGLGNAIGMDLGVARPDYFEVEYNARNSMVEVYFLASRWAKANPTGPHGQLSRMPERIPVFTSFRPEAESLRSLLVSKGFQVGKLNVLAGATCFGAICTAN